jgi:hypothetical protein
MEKAEKTPKNPLIVDILCLQYMICSQREPQKQVFNDFSA